MTLDSPPKEDVAPQEWRRLNPRMLLVHPVQEVVRGLPALIAIVIAGRGIGREIGGLGVTGLLVLLGLVRWFTTRYRVTDEAVQIKRGLLRRREAAARLDRVRTVDVTSHLLHRALGLGRVVVGTGQNDRRRRDSDLVLDALAMPEAEQLRRELLRRHEVTVASGSATLAVDPDEPVAEAELLRLEPAWCWYAPFTLSGAVTGLALVALAWRIVSQAHVDPERVGALRSLARHYRDTPLWLDVAESALAVIVAVALLSIAGYVLAFWNFRLTRRADGMLHVTRGLLTARATTIEERRLRGAEISEPLLLRWVGGARCLAIATGLRVGRGSERGGTLLVPPAPRPIVQRTAAWILDTPAPVAAELHRHVAAARRRRVVRATTPSAIVAAGLTVPAAVGALPLWFVASLVLIPLGYLVAVDRHHSLGHRVVGAHLVTRYGSLVRRRCMVEGDAVIGWTMRRSFFQRRAGLGTLVATTAAGRQGYRLVDLTAEQADAVISAVTPGLLTEFTGAGQASS